MGSWEKLHHQFGMRAYIALCPNVIAKEQAAAKASFQIRHFFYCDTRLDSAVTAAMERLLERRARLLAPLKNMDGVAIIDSDPGGYPDPSDEQFANLLMAHRKLAEEEFNTPRLLKGLGAAWKRMAGGVNR
jgi:hypothetical protein